MSSKSKRKSPSDTRSFAILRRFGEGNLIRLPWLLVSLPLHWQVLRRSQCQAVLCPCRQRQHQELPERANEDPHPQSLPNPMHGRPIRHSVPHLNRYRS